jgi:hypothetical protein
VTDADPELDKRFDCRGHATPAGPLQESYGWSPARPRIGLAGHQSAELSPAAMARIWY